MSSTRLKGIAHPKSKLRMDFTVNIMRYLGLNNDFTVIFIKIRTVVSEKKVITEKMQKNEIR